MSILAVYKIERRFNSASVKRWMDHNWYWSLYASVIYLLLVYIGSRFMRNKRAYDLRRGKLADGMMLCLLSTLCSTALTMWNTGLAAFSILGAIPFITDRVLVSISDGLFRTVCVTSFFAKPHLHLWAWLFSFSKIIELGDTAFVVLRKTPLNFLHWYHHITVLVFSWFAFTVDTAISIWFGCLNFCVHSLMYTYFAAKASGRSVSEGIAQFITTLQITQMFFGFAFNVLAYIQYSRGQECSYDATLVYMGLFIYASYIVLFINFFYQRYFGKKKFKPKS